MSEPDASLAGDPPRDERPSVISFARVDADFARKLDLWGAYHRLALSSMAMAFAFGLLPQPEWLLWTGAIYLLIAALIPPVLGRVQSLTGKAWLRALLMLSDVGLVSLFIYRWGPRTSPAAFMLVPIVSGWTLIRQRTLGRFAVATTLGAYAYLLWIDASGGSTVGGILWWITLACSILGVHGLVDFTMERLHEHNAVVTRLIAEKRTRERESQLAQQLEEAQRLESLGRLAGGVAHDFNNLLTVLMGCAELAELNVTKNPLLTTRSLRDLQTTAERGASLTAQLLDFASRRPSSPKNLDLNDAVRSAAKLIDRLFDARVELRVSTWHEACVVHIDPAGFERMLLNLAINAHDAMPRGGVLTLSLSTRRFGDAEQVLLQVADTGAGIASTDLPHIFEPFFTTKARGKGTGLGLASVYGIVKQSQGQIDVESKPAQGTLFRVRWPRVLHSAVVETRRASNPGGGNERILLVDDDAEVRAVALAHLEGAGYEVLAAASGEEALDVLAHSSVQMLVSDVSMPGMSGVELARQVRVRVPSVPILLISGYSDELHHEERFLAKPFSGQRLLAEVRSALDATLPSQQSAS